MVQDAEVPKQNGAMIEMLPRMERGTRNGSKCDDGGGEGGREGAGSSDSERENKHLEEKLWKALKAGNVMVIGWGRLVGVP